MINKVTILTITSVLAIANVMCIPVSNADPVGSALNAVRALREGGSVTIGPKEGPMTIEPKGNKPNATNDGGFKTQLTGRSFVSCMVGMVGDLPLIL